MTIDLTLYIKHHGHMPKQENRLYFFRVQGTKNGRSFTSTEFANGANPEDAWEPLEWVLSKQDIHAKKVELLP